MNAFISWKCKILCDAEKQESLYSLYTNTSKRAISIRIRKKVLKGREMTKKNRKYTAERHEHKNSVFSLHIILS